MSGDRQRARQLSARVDARGDRGQAVEPGTEDPEVDELVDLAAQLRALDLSADEDFRSGLARRILATPPPTSAFHRAIALLHRGAAMLAPRPRALWIPTAAVAALLILSAFLAPLFDATTVSATGILARSDAALAALVKPSQILHRQWRVSTSVQQPDGTVARQSERTIDEWMDGADVDRVAARWYDGGSLMVGYTTVVSGDEHRPQVYFRPGLYGERLGLLSIEPTQAELETAAHEFDGDVRQALHTYLDRHYIYAPVRGERQFNHAIVVAPGTDVKLMPRVRISFDERDLEQTPVYRVRVADPASVTFHWRGDAPPEVTVGRAETLRYVVRDSFLGVRTEERYRYEDGRLRTTTRQLMKTEAIERRDLSDDPFVLAIPAGTPVRQQSAPDLLRGVAAALARASHGTTTSAPGAAFESLLLARR